MATVFWAMSGRSPPETTRRETEGKSPPGWRGPHTCPSSFLALAVTARERGERQDEAVSTVPRTYANNACGIVQSVHSSPLSGTVLHSNRTVISVQSQRRGTARDIQLRNTHIRTESRCPLICRRKARAIT